MREVKAVVTLSSGKEVDLPTTKLENETTMETEEEKKEKFKGKKPRNRTKMEDHDFTINEGPYRTIDSCLIGVSADSCPAGAS